MKWLLGVLIMSGSYTAWSDDFERGFVQLSTGERLYVEHKRAKPGHKTLFVANGLTYSTTQWQAYVTRLLELMPDLGIVLYDMDGQGKTLLDRVPNVYGGEIPLIKQVQDLNDLRHQIKVEGPSVLTGLSYGGAVALLYAYLYPEGFEQFIVMAPFLERLEPQDKWVKRQIRWHRILFPWSQATDEELYNLYLEQLVRTTYPQAEPVIMENIFKIEGIVRMVKGSKDFRAAELVGGLPKRKVHVIGAERDEHVKIGKLNEFVELIRPDALASYLIMKWTRHKIPELAPKFAAAWTAELINHPEAFVDGRTFYGDPLTGKIPSGDDSLQIPSRRTACDGWFQHLFGSR